MLQQDIVKVFTTKQSVTIGRFHLKHTLLNLQDGYIKSSSTKIIHSDAKNYHTQNQLTDFSNDKPVNDKNSLEDTAIDKTSPWGGALAQL